MPYAVTAAMRPTCGLIYNDESAVRIHEVLFPVNTYHQFVLAFSLTIQNRYKSKGFAIS
jgi:hypothetical protein